MDERLVTQLLPFIMEGLKASAPNDYRIATYMVVMRLISLSSPAPALQEGGACLFLTFACVPGELRMVLVMRKH